jgi:hypothetical protein
MKVDLIKKYSDDFAQRLLDESYEVDMSKYDLLQQWSHHWDIEELDLADTYATSMESTISGHLWGGSVDSAKSEMIRMIGEDREFMRSTFRDLFKDDLDLGLRVDRFEHHLDELYRQIKRKDHKAISHQHGRREIVLLLAARYPDKYCLHDYAAFAEMMQRLESRRIPQEPELERYFKSLRGIYKVATSHSPLLQQVLAMRCAALGITFLPSLMLMNDFMDFVAKK